MKTSELNRDIKRLASEIYRMSFESNISYFDYLEKTAKPEFIRLCYADSSFESWNLTSFKLMVRMNLSHRFIPFHQFGLNIEINKHI